MFELFFVPFFSLSLVSSAVPDATALPQEISGEIVIDDSESLFDDASTFAPDMGYPEYATDIDGNLISSEVNSAPDVSPAPEISPAPDVNLAPDAIDYVTYSDVEDIVTQAMEASTKANVDVANAYLSSSIVDCFSRVLAGLPAGTHYVAYRNNSNDSYEGFLLFDKSGKYTGDALSFSSGKLVHYYRYSYQSGYQTYYDYRYSVEDVRDMVISLNNQSLIYTDLVDGYPTLSTSFDSDRNVSFFVIWACVVLILYIIFRKK